MGPSTTKKVLVVRFDREPVSGFVHPQSYLTAAGIEVLTTSGAVQLIPFSDAKLVCFVRDFHQREPRKDLRLFAARPKTDGLWLRLKFRDEDVMDGVLVNNLLQLDGLGFNIVPPDPEYRNQRIFVPGGALDDVQVLGVVGSPLHSVKKRVLAKDQLDLFGGGA